MGEKFSVARESLLMFTRESCVLGSRIVSRNGTGRVLFVVVVCVCVCVCVFVFLCFFCPYNRAFLKPIATQISAKFLH